MLYELNILQKNMSKVLGSATKKMFWEMYFFLLLHRRKWTTRTKKRNPKKML